MPLDGADIDYAALGGIAPGTTGAVNPLAPGAAGQGGIAAGTGTGQHGVVPLIGSTIGGSMAGAFRSIWEWINRPFHEPMAPVDLFLIVGTILVAILAWNLILYHIRIAAESI